MKTAAKGISSSALKLFAMLVMLIDHAAVVFFEDAAIAAAPGSTLFSAAKMIFSGELFGLGTAPALYFIGKLTGRLAFPIFAFLLGEGFRHTRDVKKYSLRLAAFAVISEIPFNLVASGSFFYLKHQNIFFTLLAGLLALRALEGSKPRVPRVVSVLLISLAAEFFDTDYGAYGVLIIVLFYLTANRKSVRNIICGTALLYQLTAPLALVPINFYNGKRGFGMKYMFYVFYPAHLTVLYLLSRLI